MNNNKEIYEKYWSEEIDDYKRFSAGNLWYNSRLQKLIDKYVDKNEVKSVIDAGCGDGIKTFLLAEIFNNAKVKGIDFTSASIKHASNLYKRENLSFEVMDVSSINEVVDCITCLEVLEHVDDWNDVLDKFIKCSPKYIIVSTVTGRMRECEKIFGHVRNFKVGEIEEYMTKNGYATLMASYGGFPLYSPIMRDLSNKNGKKYYDTQTVKMSDGVKFAHKIVAFLLKYFCFQNRKGDALIAVFKKSASE